MGWKLAYAIILIACTGNGCSHNKNITTLDSDGIRDSVYKMTESIAEDVTMKGPRAWLLYFEDTPSFYMASDGRLVFPDYDSARNFINNTLVHSISKIMLKWKDIHTDVLSQEFTNISAAFHEDITDAAGKTISINGYFTALAHRAAAGWRLRNAHWSIIKVS